MIVQKIPRKERGIFCTVSLDDVYYFLFYGFSVKTRFSFGSEFNSSSLKRKERMVPSDLYVFAGKNDGSSLTYNN